MRFEGEDVEAIERALERARSGAWRRARVAEITLARFKAFWRVDLPKSWHNHPFVTHIFVGIDEFFPWSDPRVVAPQANTGRQGSWPHVESGGLLCLSTSRYDDDAGDRVLLAIRDSLELFSWDRTRRESEFQREFASYWDKHETKGVKSDVSLVAPSGGDRDISYWRISDNRTVFADDIAVVSRWLRHRGELVPRLFPTTRLRWLEEPLTPDRYPETGSDLLELIGQASIETHIQGGHPLPVLLGARTDRGGVFVSATLTGPTEKQLKKGFRNIGRVPRQTIVDACKRFSVIRKNVNRADAEWVHGRGHNPDLPLLRTKAVAIVGCGAIGGYIARLLIQSGVGSMMLIDADIIGLHNTSRHVLGARHDNCNKALALKQSIEAEFPSVVEVSAEPTQFELLKKSALDRLAKVDLIVTAGLDLRADIAMQHWREVLDSPPPWICTWTEEFALAGHAVAFLGSSRFSDGLDARGRVLSRLTKNWPIDIATLGEPGCGATFQPYGSIDLQGTVNVAARLGVDVLFGRVSTGCDRVWLGDREMVVKLGATPSDDFNQSFSERELSWPSM